MKISDMTNDQIAETFIQLADPIGRLCDDEEALNLIDEYKAVNGKKPLFYIVGRIMPRLIAYLMKTHKNEVYEIVSVLSGEKLSAVGEMKFPETVRIIKESYDDMLSAFFTQSGGVTKGNAMK